MMDAGNKQLEALLDKTDQAFKQLLEQPDSTELESAYEDAKNELSDFLHNMRSGLKKRYKEG